METTQAACVDTSDLLACVDISDLLACTAANLFCISEIDSPFLSSGRNPTRQILGVDRKVSKIEGCSNGVNHTFDQTLDVILPRPMYVAALLEGGAASSSMQARTTGSVTGSRTCGGSSRSTGIAGRSSNKRLCGNGPQGQQYPAAHYFTCSMERSQR
ncbi:hypothetical protein DACRYDRAFT_113972 [Dacryopinax primogenitus]|uniref:Uncharacterized protein n=1 Tax=Dacryopinax primogenitus (strain DJM 731) TaxID=1858805 RepID=M5GDJ4_DACPD|nr:uncharacterized protein DACRYDRAFT_113972 [Dacryopinax primogenitus]EJU04577.1 hypothetical protein DACRYDRAFT_113972 [Dacryopinax primogenitus]